LRFAGTTIRNALLVVLLPLGCADVADAPAVRVGDTVAHYAAPLLEGDTFRLGTGQLTLLNVWATWCPPCREEMPELQALHDRYGPEGLRVVGVSIDTRRAESLVREFIDELDITFPIALDPEERVGGVIVIQGMPTTVLVDENRRVVWRHLGAVTADDPGLLEQIRARLNASSN
jgi:cytochrome c biogenesis protein CcmG, thiol:disulfide interchange protein DsbE